MDDTLNHAPCGFLRVADDGTILAANATLLALLGRSPEGGGDGDDPACPLRGLHVGAILSPGARAFYQTHFFPLLRMHGRADEVYLTLRSAAGEDVPVLVNAVRREYPVGGGAAGDAADWVLVAMRQRDRFEAEILRGRKAAEEATRERERALAALARVNDELEAGHGRLRALNDRLRAHADREAFLHRLARALRARAGSEEVLLTATTALGERLGADRCFVADRDPARGRSRVRAEWRRTGLPPLPATYPDAGAAGGAPASGPPSAPPAALRALGVRSAVVAPSPPSGAAPDGALVVAAVGEPRAWTSDEAELVREVAELAQSAAAEARLREKEHRIAEQLQAALQPPVPEDVPGLKVYAHYRAALEEASVGGDFYDVFPLDGGRCALVVADLSGKGLAAAAQVATVRHMLRALLYQPGGTSLRAALTTLNDMLAGHNLLNGFATLFAGAYDPARRTLAYVNAGQEPGLIRRAPGGAPGEELGPTGPVLGGFPGAAYEERAVALGPGDVLALFTDGLTEAGASRKDLLELSGVAEILDESADDAGIADDAPRVIATRVMRRVEEAATPAGMRDDVCLLVVCVQ